MDVAREWIMKTVGRKCSDKVLDDLFDLAWDMSHTMSRLRDAGNGKRPRLKFMRKKIMSDIDSSVSDFIFEDLSLDPSERHSNRIELNNQSSLPRVQFPSDEYQLVHQFTKVPVCYYFRY